MASPVVAWHQEHLHFNQLLALMQREMDCFHEGGDPAYQRILDILAYLRDYGDQFHHPREDEAFRRLLTHCPDRQLPVARLLQEHRVIAHAGETLRDLLLQASHGEVVQRSAIEAAAATYLVYYGSHLAKEELEILPRAARHLTASDWQAVKDVVPQAGDPMFGPRPEKRFRELRESIATQAA